MLNLLRIGSLSVFYLPRPVRLQKHEAVQQQRTCECRFIEIHIGCMSEMIWTGVAVCSRCNVADGNGCGSIRVGTTDLKVGFQMLMPD